MKEVQYDENYYALKATKQFFSATKQMTFALLLLLVLCIGFLAGVAFYHQFYGWKLENKYVEEAAHFGEKDSVSSVTTSTNSDLPTTTVEVSVEQDDDDYDVKSFTAKWEGTRLVLNVTWFNGTNTYISDAVYDDLKQLPEVVIDFLYKLGYISLDKAMDILEGISVEDDGPSMELKDETWHSSKAEETSERNEGGASI